ncbi:hypothetical protein CSUI_009600 [Cystoisospora suis]|uniref:Uncharacterized protein n=1 Tax=Cystoisospora suis TaxID=483139 RepID=A0A2C6KJC1_9APIC|nr:hypothetical protein CSUI_009600 [Cystoisospora suis]
MLLSGRRRFVYSGLRAERVSAVRTECITREDEESAKRGVIPRATLIANTGCSTAPRVKTFYRKVEYISRCALPVQTTGFQRFGFSGLPHPSTLAGSFRRPPCCRLFSLEPSSCR